MEKEKEQTLSNIPVGFQVLEENKIDDTRFVRVKIWLLHLGYSETRNIYFPREVVDEAIPTLKNIPILGRIKKNRITGKIDFSNHNPRQRYDGKVILDTDVIGVIPESNKAKYEKRICDDYVEREFLTVEGLLWSDRADIEIEILKETGKKQQSMELSREMTKYEVDDEGRLVAVRLGFNGACIVGDHERPAISNSSLELFSKDEVERLSEEITEKLQNYYSIDKGGVEEVGEIKNEGIETKDAVDTTKEVEKQTEEVVVEEETKTTEEKTVLEKVEEKAEGTKETKEEEIVDKAEEKKQETVEEEEDKKKSEENEKETKQEPKPKKEEKSGKVKLPVNFTEEELDGILVEIKELREFKEKVELERREKQEQSLFSKYQALEGLEEFKEVKENSSNFTLEELDREFALIYANNADALNFSSSVGVDEAEKEDETSFLFSRTLEKNSSSRYGNLLKKHDLDNIGSK